MTRITIEDVAAEAGVSVTTVSHVFSGHRPVSDSTSERVRKIARDLGYRPNAIAKSLRVQRTFTAMIVLPDITNPFYPALARGVQDVLRTGGYQTLLCNTDAQDRDERAFLDEAMSRRVDGVVFMGFHVPVTDLEPLAESGIAVVNLGYGQTRAPIDIARFDDRAAAEEAVGYLLRSAPGNVGFIDGNASSPVAEARLQGFLDAYAAAGVAVPEGHVVSVDFTREGGRDGMRRLLAAGRPPRAVFCANDLIALGAIDIAHERGLAIPGDIAIMGCDDIDAADIVTPRLTTVRNSADEIGRTCGELLLSRMTGVYSGPGREVVVPYRIVVRDSA
ncbi:LacI family transcriptional regulator [Agromyces protaetiae]|uniref:LacI family transcriptional regulator n=1 Tax=Agromyces protaetiae TaxID=2509455 RepID=A0A4P6F944_9MICO|nr:LacI family DNA-binding transcriptional regulator [Agromyces protaetiae]QAY72392.1 LacI family transcriptional regulator [Agromyces protaetiae]